MSIGDAYDLDIVGRLRRLDAVARDSRSGGDPGFDYDGLLARHETKKARARRRAAFARGTASAVVLAMVALSVWRLNPADDPMAIAVPELTEAESPQPRLVRADTWLALATLEDHIASIDDALNSARLDAPGSAEVARLERTRAELMTSYAHVRYAEMVSTSY